MGMIRGIVTAVTEGVIKLFSGSGRSDETFEDREYLQHYGFTSRPLAGAELIIINEDNHYCAVASDDRRYRIAVEDGEVCLYTDEGDKIHFKRDKTIEIICGNKLTATVTNNVEVTCKDAKVTVENSIEATCTTALVTASGSCQVESPQINLGGDRGGLRTLIDDRLLSLFNNHTHSGVQTGSGTSGAPTTALTSAAVCTAITKAG